jgi:tRNA nucleotidyltransferase (CCA-adding enzyme)
VSTPIRQFVQSLDVDAYVVGGAVRDELLGLPHRDEDFLVPGVDHAALRALLQPHGRVDDLEVHGQLVGVRLYPRDPAVLRLVPAGIEFTPPRVERSIGPGHRHFEIVTDSSLTLEQDMARRDFTINAMARRLATDELVDPFGGQADLQARLLRTVTPESFREDPLRIVRGLRFVSQLGVDPTDETLEQMQREAAGLVYVSAERIGGGLAADSMGELSKLLLGREPARALTLARDTASLGVILPEVAATIGVALDDPRQPLSVDEHIFAVVQYSADVGASLAVRLAALFHDTGKPEALRTGTRHAALGAELTGRALSRLRYPTAIQRRVVDLVRAHTFSPSDHVDGADARRFLAEHGDDAAFELLTLKDADLRARIADPAELDAVAAFRAMLEGERTSPHRPRDLAVDGTDLIKAGFSEGPLLGSVLSTLLDEVIADPTRNDPAWLIERAVRELA